MIFYGTNSKNIGSKELKHETCKHCGKEGTIVSSVFSGYFYIYRIPVFPLGKEIINICTHCKHAIEYSEMSEPEKQKAKETKNEFKTPILHFIGLIIIAGLIITGVIMDKIDK